MLNKNMQKLMSALTLVGAAGSASLPIIAEASSCHSENEQEQRFEHQREEQRGNYDNHYDYDNRYDYDNNYDYDNHYNHDN